MPSTGILPDLHEQLCSTAYPINGSLADWCWLMFDRFLLKYVSRDEVTLLRRGTGGVPDVRSAVEGYEEKSPLYGFLQYRRRKVVLKYVPEGISRLLQGEMNLDLRHAARWILLPFVVSEC